MYQKEAIWDAGMTPNIWVQQQTKIHLELMEYT